MTSDFFTAATMKAVFQDVAPCSLVNLLSFYPEDGGSTSIREVYTRLHGVTSDLQNMNHHWRVFSSQNFSAIIDENKYVSRDGPCVGIDSNPEPSKCEGLLITHPEELNKDSRRKWRKEDRRRRGTKDRTAYIVSDDTDGRHSECWCIYCDYYYTAQTGSVRHAITILQFPNERSTEQHKICETCARSFTQRHFLHVKGSSPRLLCGTVIMFTASISSSDTTPSNDKARRQFVMGRTGSTLRSCAWTPPEEVKCLAIPGYLSFGFPWLYISS